MVRARRVRIRKGAVAELTRIKRRTGEQLRVYVYTDLKGKVHEVDEYRDRKEQLEEANAVAIGDAETKRLYSSDAKLVRNPPEIVAGRDIEGVTLTAISPSAAWKEAVFRFKTQRKMMPNTFCRLLAMKAWRSM